MSRIALACFVLGVVLMIPFDHVLTRVFGVLALFAAVVTGVFAIATPGFLEAEDDEGEDASAAAPTGATAARRSR